MPIHCLENSRANISVSTTNIPTESENKYLEVLKFSLNKNGRLNFFDGVLKINTYSHKFETSHE